MNINELPPELLLRIFSNIGGFTEETRLEHVCSHWRQIVPVNWKMTKTCPKLEDRKTLGLLLNRCGEWLEELWFFKVKIDEKMVKQMAKWMKCLKHLKLSYCKLDGSAVNSITDLFGQKLCSFILYETEYHPNMRRLIENASKLEHLSLNLSHNYCHNYCHNYSVGSLPTKLPNNLKTLFFYACDNEDSTLLMNIARDCKNLKILHFKSQILTPNIILAIGNIKSLVYFNLDALIPKVDTNVLKNVICSELPNLKAYNGYYDEEFSRDCPADLVHLNVYARHPFQLPDSLNSLTLRMDYCEFLPEMLFNQQSKSIQHLDIRSSILPSSSEFIKKLLGQFPDLKTIHCKLPNTGAEFTSLFSFIGSLQEPNTDAKLTSLFTLIEHHLENGRKITIYLHFDPFRDAYYAHYKYILPDDLPQFNAGWRPKVCERVKCENLVLKKLIKEAIEGGNEPSFLDIWME